MTSPQWLKPLHDDRNGALSWSSWYYQRNHVRRPIPLTPAPAFRKRFPNCNDWWDLWFRQFIVLEHQQANTTTIQALQQVAMLARSWHSSIYPLLTEMIWDVRDMCGDVSHVVSSKTKEATVHAHLWLAHRWRSFFVICVQWTMFWLMSIMHMMSVNIRICLIFFKCLRCPN